MARKKEKATVTVVAEFENVNETDAFVEEVKYKVADYGGRATKLEIYKPATEASTVNALKDDV